jgi:hypothetical protein
MDKEHVRDGLNSSKSKIHDPDRACGCNSFLQPVLICLADVLICFESKVLVAGCWFGLVCSDRKILLAGG